MSFSLSRRLTLCGLLSVPALVVRLAGIEVAPPVAVLVFGAAVVAASFLLAWAAEAAQMDISGGLAIALLALVAVLPEYVVDLYFAYTSGHDPSYVAFAAANMTGSNRLLLGLGWSLVVLIGLHWSRRRSGKAIRELVLDSGYRAELGFLGIASLLALVVPATGQLGLVVGIPLLALFGYYLYRASRGEAEEPDLAGSAAAIGALPRNRRRALVSTLFVFSAVVVLLAAEPFAHGLIGTGRQFGVDEFLLVQWLAPLASEAPEFIVAVLFAVRGKAGVAIGTLIASKVNQWTLLVGSLPVAHLLGGGSGTLHLDARQVEEFLLTITQTALGVAALLALRFPRWAAWTLLALFAVQFAVPGQQARYVLCALYAVIALVAFVRNRRHILPTLAAPFARSREPERELTSVG